MVVKRRKRIYPDYFAFDGLKFERVSSFKYLGSIVTSISGETEEIMRRTAPGNNTYFALKRLIRSHQVSRKTKLLLYKI